MPILSDPAWLLLAALVPLLRWFHRWRRPARRRPVPAVFLWAGQQKEEAAGHVRHDPDPAWRRRALVVLVLGLSLAGPSWLDSGVPVTVWIDDSLSMRTVEAGRTRLQTGLARLTERLSESGYGDVTLRSMGDPAYVRQYADPAEIDADSWLARPPARAMGYGAGLPDRGSSHWVLTDGASARVRDWIALAGPQRVVTVGSETENAAVVLLAARRRADASDGVDIVASVANTGAAEQVRRLRLLAGDRLVAEFDLAIAAGQTSHLRSTTDRMLPELRAVLPETDALAADDQLSLSLSALEPLATHVEPACPASLERAVVAHPALRRSESPGEAGLRVACLPAGSTAPLGAAAQINFWSGSAGPVSGRIAWAAATPAERSIALEADWLTAGGWPESIDIGQAEPLLSAGDRPLAVSRKTRDGAVLIDTVLDPGDDRFARRPEFALLFAALVDRATGRQLLDEYLGAHRDIVESQVSPVGIDVEAGTAAREAAVVRPLSLWFLILAALALIYDIGKTAVDSRPGGRA